MNEEIIKFIIIFVGIFCFLLIFLKFRILPNLKWGDKELNFTHLNKDQESQKNQIDIMLQQMTDKLEFMNKTITSLESYKQEAESNKLLIKDLKEKNEYFSKEILMLNKKLSIYQEQGVDDISKINKLTLEIDTQLKLDLKNSCLRNHFLNIKNFDGYISEKINYYTSNLKSLLLKYQYEYSTLFDLDYIYVEELIDKKFIKEFQYPLRELFYSFKNINIEIANKDEFLTKEKEADNVDGLIIKYYNYLLSKISKNYESSSFGKQTPKELIINIKNENILSKIIDKIIEYRSSKSELMKTMVLDKQIEASSYTLYTIRKFFDIEFKKLLIQTLDNKN